MLKAKTCAIIAIVSLVLLTLGMSTASASLVDLEVLNPVTGAQIGTPSNPLEVCPRPITIPGDVKIKLTNLGANTDSFDISIEELPEGWEGQIESTITLGPGESS